MTRSLRRQLSEAAADVERAKHHIGEFRGPSYLGVERRIHYKSPEKIALRLDRLLVLEFGVPVDTAL